MSDPISEHAATEPTELLDSPETSWPKAIGIISIILAIGGLGCQVLAIGSVFLTEIFMGMGGMDVAMPGLMKITTGITAVIMTCLGFLMLAGGIGVLRRRRGGVSKLRTWAILRVVMIAIGVVGGVLTLPANMDFQRSVQEATNEMLRKNGQTSGIKEFDEDAVWVQSIVMIGVMSGLFAIYPLFIAFYLSRQKIKDEVETWE